MAHCIENARHSLCLDPRPLTAERALKVVKKEIREIKIVVAVIASVFGLILLVVAHDPALAAKHAVQPDVFCEPGIRLSSSTLSLSFPAVITSNRISLYER